MVVIVNAKRKTTKVSEREKVAFVLSGAEANEFSAIVKKDCTLEAEEFVLIEHPAGPPGEMVLGVVVGVKNVNASYTEQSPLVPFFQRGENTQIGDQDFTVAKVAVHGAVKDDARGIRSLVPLFAAPVAGQPVYRADSGDVRQYLMSLEPPGVEIGTMKNYEVRVALSVPKLFMHLAVLGVTGAGKSHALKVLLNGLKGLGSMCPPVLIVDPHGEYLAYADEVVDPGPYVNRSIREITPEYFQEFLKVRFGKSAASTMVSKVVDQYLEGNQWPPESPGPLLALLDDPNIKGSSKTTTVEEAKRILGSRHVDRLFTTPRLDVRAFLKPETVTVLDVGAIELTKQQEFLRRLLDIIYDQATKLHAEGGAFAGIVVIDEVQRYAPESQFATGDAYKESRKAIFNVAAQGRKFGIGLVVASQRPAYVSKSVLAQCNTQLIFRLVAWPDLQTVRDVLGSQGVLQRLPYQPTGDAVLYGIASATEFPVVVSVDALPPRKGARDFSVKYEDRLAEFKAWHGGNDPGA
ncbi:MAG: hypothetical protein Kow0069_16230 [Promethearchaeota archaeon]